MDIVLPILKMNKLQSYNISYQGHEINKSRARMKPIFCYVFNSKPHAFPPTLNTMLKEKRIPKKIMESHSIL